MPPAAAAAIGMATPSNTISSTPKPNLFLKRMPAYVLIPVMSSTVPHLPSGPALHIVNQYW